MWPFQQFWLGSTSMQFLSQPSTYWYLWLYNNNSLIAALHRVWPGLNTSYPADSCTQILDVIPNAPSCKYWLRSSSGSVMQVFCNMTLFPCKPGFSEEGATCKGKSIPGPRSYHAMLTWLCAFRRWWVYSWRSQLWCPCCVYQYCWELFLYMSAWLCWRWSELQW